MRTPIEADSRPGPPFPQIILVFPTRESRFEANGGRRRQAQTKFRSLQRTLLESGTTGPPARSRRVVVEPAVSPASSVVEADHEPLVAAVQATLQQGGDAKHIGARRVGQGEAANETVAQIVPAHSCVVDPVRNSPLKEQRVSVRSRSVGSHWLWSQRRGERKRKDGVDVAVEPGPAR